MGSPGRCAVIAEAGAAKTPRIPFAKGVRSFHTGDAPAYPSLVAADLQAAHESVNAHDVPKWATSLG